jgi:mRNA interferase MazF
VGVVVRRFDVFLVNLDPTVGSEIKKTRPCLIVSPDEMNRAIRTVIIAPMTSQGKAYPTRIPCLFQGKEGLILLDQLRTVDKQRLVRKIGKLDDATSRLVANGLVELFTL